LRARGVSATTSSTSAVRQGMRGARSVTVVPLLFPGVAVDVVAVRLPEAGPVGVHEAQPAHPLGRLPEVEVRHEEARRAAVLRGERLAVVFVGDQALVAAKIGDRDVGGVAAVAERHDVRTGRPAAGGGAGPGERHALPPGVELGPFGHAVDVDADLRRGEGEELLPRPAVELVPRRVLEGEGPGRERAVRRRARRQDGEVVRDVLARRDALGALPLAAKAARDHAVMVARWAPPGPSIRAGLALPSAARRVYPRADMDRVLELRQYTLHPGGRDVLIDLFDREFVEPQEAVGMHVVGQFRDLDDPDRFVWLRGFTDMISRADALAAFYGGPVWQAHRGAANATMVDSDNVLLLRPVYPGAGFPRPRSPRSPLGAGAGERGTSVVAVTIYYAKAAIDAEVRAFFMDSVRREMAAAGAPPLALL